MIHSNSWPAKYSRHRYNTLKEQHRCTKCGKKDERTNAGKCTCAECNEKLIDYANKRNAEKENEKNRGCAYCNCEDLIFNGRTCEGMKQRKNVGIDIYIVKNELVIDSVADTLDDCEMHERVRIRYCPMCGRKFKR